MPTYQIEMLWECAQCQHRGNRGLARHCENCGHPKDDKCREYFPDDISEANAIQDVDKLAQAKAGPDWKCQYCETLQSTIGPFCAYCGADRKTGEKPWQTKVQTVTQNVETVKVSSEIIPEVLAPNTYQSVAPVASYKPPAKIRRLSKKTIIALGSSLACVVLALILWLSLRTKIVDARVGDVIWEYRVYIDRYQIWRRDGWGTDIGAFDIRNEGSRIHHYDRVVAGSHQEPYSESYTCGESCSTTPRTCTSNQNGSATCSGGDQVCTPKSCTRTAYRTVTDYRDEPRYQDWYSWNVWDWGHNRTIRTSGHNLEPKWPTQEALTVPLAQGERERHRREENYQIVFDTADRKVYHINPKSETEFKKYPLGRFVRLKVGLIHGVEVLP